MRELESVGSGDNDRPVRWGNGLILTKLDQSGQGHPCVGAVEHTCRAQSVSLGNLHAQN